MKLKKKTKIKKVEFIKVDTYKGYDVYIYTLIAKEDVATMMPNSRDIATAIVLRPEAYEILKARPNLLKKVYDHELKENTEEGKITHNNGDDNNVLKFLKIKGYDFGDFKF